MQVKRLVVLVLAIGCSGGHGEPGEVTPGCVMVADEDAFAPAVDGTLEDWDLDGRWFVLDPDQGQWSLRLDHTDSGVVIDHEQHVKLDDTKLTTRTELRDPDGTRTIYARRITNLRADGTLRHERMACVNDECTLCTSKLIRATHNADESEASHLTLLGELGGGATWSPGFTLNVRVAGTLAYLIRRDGLHIIETRDPAHPVELGFYSRDTKGSRNDVKVIEAGARRFALIAETPVDVVDVTDPAAPVLAAQIPETAHTVFTETRAGKTLAYFGGLDGNCPVYDVTDPAVPAKLGSYATGAVMVHDLSVVDGIAYLNAWDKGFMVVDFTTPATPRLVGTWATTPIQTSHSNWTTTAGGRHIALHGDEGYSAHLDIVDVDPASPTFMTSIAAWQTRPYVSIHNVMAFGTKAYFTYYQDGVRVLDLSDPLHPTQLGYFNTWDPQDPGATSFVFEGAVGLDVDLARKLIFVADSPRGLLILADQTP